MGLTLRGCGREDGAYRAFTLREGGVVELEPLAPGRHLWIPLPELSVAKRERLRFAAGSRSWRPAVPIDDGFVVEPRTLQFVDTVDGAILLSYDDGFHLSIDYRPDRGWRDSQGHDLAGARFGLPPEDQAARPGQRSRLSTLAG